MSLRKRLFLVFLAFGAYAVLSAVVAIYGNQLRIEQAAAEFQRVAGQTTHVEALELNLTRQMLLLRELISGLASDGREYAEVRENWTADIQQLMAFTTDVFASDSRTKLVSLVESLERDCDECLRLLHEGRAAEAANLLNDRVATQTIPALQRLFFDFKTALSSAQNRSARRLAASSSQTLILTFGVGAFAAVLLTVGSVLVNRWLFRPLSHLQATAGRFGRGDLTAKTNLSTHDELGELGSTLDEMARALHASQRKDRTLFSNLRDAVVICDASCRILEYHDGDTGILGVVKDRHIGRHLLEVWPEWTLALRDWPGVIDSAANMGRCTRAHDVQLTSAGADSNGIVADFVIYPVEFGDTPSAAILVRDVTEQYKMQARLRHAETMEALGTIAAGLAHDVNNILSSATATLSSLSIDLRGSTEDDRIQEALRACRQAAGLTKRLLNFACGAQGNAQVFAPAQIIDAIVDSGDPSAFSTITVVKQVDHSLRIQMDQDEFAQIVLNLVRNACDAMPGGGTLEIRLETIRTRHPDRKDGDRDYAALSVSDTGPGIPPEAQGHIFEPFYTTKSRAGSHGRGLGLAIVYSAVKHAGGFIQVESSPSGTTMRVYLPTFARENAAQKSSPDPVLTNKQ